MDRGFVTGFEVVPVEEWLSLMDKPVGTGLRHPFEVAQVLWSQLYAVGNNGFPVGIVTAAAGLRIQQFAMEARVGDFACVFVFQFEEATLCAAIAKGLPLIG